MLLVQRAATSGIGTALDGVDHRAGSQFGCPLGSWAASGFSGGDSDQQLWTWLAATVLQKATLLPKRRIIGVLEPRVGSPGPPKAF